MAGYTRQSVGDIVDGAIVEADPINDEYNALQAAFASNTGHSHDGTTGNGAPITSTGPTLDVNFGATTVSPRLNNVVSLGSSALRFKNLYLSGDILSLGGLTLSGAVSLLSTLTVTGNTTLKDVVVDNLSAEENVGVSGDVDIGGDINVDGVMTVSGVSATGYLASTGGIGYSFVPSGVEGLKNPTAGTVDLVALGSKVTVGADGFRTSGDVISSGRLVATTGNAAAPTLTFVGDSNTGFYNEPDAILGTTGGVRRFRLDTVKLISSVPFRGPNGTTSVPAYSFDNSSSTGMWMNGSGVLGFSTSGVERLALSTSNLDSSLTFRTITGSASLPSITFTSDSDTGIYNKAANALGFTVGGAEALSLTSVAMTTVKDFTAPSVTAPTVTTTTVVGTGDSDTSVSFPGGNFINFNAEGSLRARVNTQGLEIPSGHRLSIPSGATISGQGNLDLGAGNFVYVAMTGGTANARTVTIPSTNTNTFYIHPHLANTSTNVTLDVNGEGPLPLRMFNGANLPVGLLDGTNGNTPYLITRTASEWIIIDFPTKYTSDANGQCWRMSNGLMICKHIPPSIDLSIAIAFHGGFRSGAVTWNFTYPFVDSIPSYTVESTGASSFSTAVMSTGFSSVGYAFTGPTSNGTPAPRSVSLGAIGRWF